LLSEELILVQDMLLLPQEVVHNSRLVIAIAFELLGGGLEEPHDHPSEVVRLHVQRVDQRQDLLVGQQTLVQTLVQEVIVQTDDLVHRLHFLQVAFELIVVRLKDFKEHVVEVVFGELLHFEASAH
jgi:hypothetical protein